MDKNNHFNYTQYNPTDTSLMIQSIYFLMPTMLGLFVMVASIATVGETVWRFFTFLCQKYLNFVCPGYEWI
jgi:hypothetical protein